MNDEDFMQEAIKDAKKHQHHFGAVVVKNKKILSRGGKRPAGDPRHHAETEAILNTKKRNLKGCTLYTTCEPCPMCFYMAWITGIKRIVYGASIKDAAKRGHPQIKVSNAQLNRKSGKKIILKKGILKQECIELLN